MIVSWSQVNDELKKFSVFVNFETVSDEIRIIFFIYTCNQFTQRVFGTFYDLALVSSDLFENENLTIARRRNCIGYFSRPGSGDSSYEERAEGGVFFQRMLNFFEVDCVEFRISCVDRLPKNSRDLHFRYHLCLFAESRLESVLSRTKSTLL